MNADSKVAVVTGASWGMGSALVTAFRGRGYRVIATARSMTVADGPEIPPIAGDIGDRRTAERAISEGMARFGRIDTLVNNAGIFVSKTFTSYTVADLETILAVNTLGFFHITQLAVAEMENRGGGHVVQITTTLADQASSRVPAVLSALTKGGLNAATRALAIEYARRGIRANAVSPGIIRTPMHPPETHPALDGLHPIGHMGEISDIVRAVLYLEDAPFVTGEILHVDGGQSAGH